MEHQPEDNNKLKSASKQHIIKKIVLHSESKRSNSPSSSDDKKTEDSKEAPDSSEKPSDENTDNRSSPEPNCAICLEQLQNKSFTDSCFHTFCFTCLLEWSKVKPECPLCKQRFKSIVHNVKDKTFEEYHITSRTTNMNSSTQFWSYYSRSEQRFRYPSTMTSARIMERNLSTDQESYQSQIASHRMRYAPHTLSLYSRENFITRGPCIFRRRVYASNLWVRPPVNGRTRLATPEFYKQHPACTHRLIAWLNRELVSLWRDNEAHVTFVLELIMSLIVRYEITSEEFLIHIEPYMGSYTHHFIHEFYQFAISPYDMENYDRSADYGLNGDSIQSPSSPDSDVIAIYTGESNASSSIPRRPSIRMKQIAALKRLKKLILKKNSANTWESMIASPTRGLLSLSDSLNVSNPGPSTSEFSRGNLLSVDGNSTNFTSLADIEDTDDDECQIVDVVKPKTPEVVDLSSDEEQPLTVINVSSEDEHFSPYSPPSSLISPLSPPMFLNYPSDSSSSDIECVYHAIHPSTSKEVAKVDDEVSLERDPKVEEEQEKDSNSTSATEEFDSDVLAEVKNCPKVASAIVRPWAMDSDAPSKNCSSSSTSREKRRISSSPHLDDSLTESFSDDELSGEKKTGCKKLKLRSVVAHFSFDLSDSKNDSNHRLSHKKHKEKKKKKKKKKHVHKHKHRIVSDSDSG